MLVLVVGASGVVGRQLVPQLLEAGHAVVATTRSSPPPAAAERLEHRRLDLLDAAAVTALVHEIRPDAIVHQATALSRLSNNLRRFDALFTLTNQLRTTGTAHLIDASRDVGWPRLLVQSFCGWPWATVGGPVKTEDDPLEPDPPKSFRVDAAGHRRPGAAGARRPPQRGGAALRRALRPGQLADPRAAVRCRTQGLVPADRLRRGHLVLRAYGGRGVGHRRGPDRRGPGSTTSSTTTPHRSSEWLPEMARLAGGPPPRRVPAWVGWLAGGDGLVRMMTQVRGSSNAKARAELGWVPRYPSWRQGFAAEFGRGAT